MGAPRGRVQRGRELVYTPESGRPWRPAATLSDENAEKLAAMYAATGISVSGLLNKLIEQADVDAGGRPSWFEADAQSQERLIA